MAETEENDSKIAPDTSDKPVIEEPCPICPRCMQPCNPHNDYCLNCDSNEAMNPLVTYMPFESIRFIAGLYGRMFKAVFFEKQTSWVKRIFYFVILLIAVPVILVIAFPLYLTDKIKNPELRKAALIVVVVLIILLLTCLIFWPQQTNYGSIEWSY
jgi:hypothetical protein